jgi:hypothetical protein
MAIAGVRHGAKAFAFSTTEAAPNWAELCRQVATAVATGDFVSLRLHNLELPWPYHLWPALTIGASEIRGKLHPRLGGG